MSSGEERWVNTVNNRNNLIKETARNLRKHNTKSEKIFWEVVRNRKIKGKKIQRQFPIRFEIDGQQRFFIADFYYFQNKLVVEIDGPIHNFQKDYDEIRTQIINRLGIKVIRFTNEDIENNLDDVISKLKNSL